MMRRQLRNYCVAIAGIVVFPTCCKLCTVRNAMCALGFFIAFALEIQLIGGNNRTEDVIVHAKRVSDSTVTFSQMYGRLFRKRNLRCLTFGTLTYL